MLYGNLYGMELIESENMVDFISIQRRKHRQKRLNKKYKKKYGLDTIKKPKQQTFIFDGKIICHPEIAKKIRQAIKDMAK